jgi:hypothetical protein
MNCLSGIAWVLLLAAPAAAQQFTGSRAGMIHHAEGIVYLNEQQLQFLSSNIREVAKGESLRTANGWVEIQLGTAAFLWMGENGLLRVEEPDYTKTKMLIESGSILVEIYNYNKENNITLRFNEATIQISKPGLYRLDCGNSQFRVFRGRAKIQQAGNTATVKRGKAAAIDGGLKVAAFDRSQMDPLQKIAMQRSRILFPTIQAQDQRAAKTPPLWQDQQLNEQQRRLAEEEWRRQQETWREQNRRAPDSQEGHQQPPWAVPQ